jgi:hypothetical protein
MWGKRRTKYGLYTHITLKGEAGSENRPKTEKEDKKDGDTL